MRRNSVRLGHDPSQRKNNFTLTILLAEQLAMRAKTGDAQEAGADMAFAITRPFCHERVISQTRIRRGGERFKDRNKLGV